MDVPLIYSRVGQTPRLTLFERSVALGIAACAIGVLITAAWLQPATRGYGTHTQLGLQPCGFYMQTGIPCIGCGMTTSFAYMVRFRLIASFVAQPFGLILCVLTAAAFWGGLYVAATGRAAYRLIAIVPMRAHVVIWPTLAGAAWLWKIALSMR